MNKNDREQTLIDNGMEMLKREKEKILSTVSVYSLCKVSYKIEDIPVNAALKALGLGNKHANFLAALNKIQRDYREANDNEEMSNEETQENIDAIFKDIIGNPHNYNIETKKSDQNYDENREYYLKDIINNKTHQIIKHKNKPQYLLSADGILYMIVRDEKTGVDKATYIASKKDKKRKIIINFTVGTETKLLELSLDKIYSIFYPGCDIKKATTRSNPKALVQIEQGDAHYYLNSSDNTYGITSSGIITKKYTSENGYGGYVAITDENSKKVKLTINDETKIYSVVEILKQFKDTNKKERLPVVVTKEKIIASQKPIPKTPQKKIDDLLLSRNELTDDDIEALMGIEERENPAILKRIKNGQPRKVAYGGKTKDPLYQNLLRYKK